MRDNFWPYDYSQSNVTFMTLPTFSYSVEHDRDLLVFTDPPFEEAYEDAVGHVFPFHLVCFSVRAAKHKKLRVSDGVWPEIREIASDGFRLFHRLTVEENQQTYVAYPNTIFAVTLSSPGCTMTTSYRFLKEIFAADDLTFNMMKNSRHIESII